MAKRLLRTDTFCVCMPPLMVAVVMGIVVPLIFP